MSNLLFPIVTSTLGAAAETVTLAAQVLAVIFGLRAVTDALDILAKAIAALRWLAGLLQLLVMLVCSVIGDVAPIVGRHAGRLAGQTVAAGAAAGRAYRRHLQPTVSALVQHLDRNGRQFVVQQLGTAYPALTAAIASSVAPSSPIATPVSPEPATASLTRRQLLQLAKAQGLPRYSRLSTEALAAALT